MASFNVVVNAPALSPSQKLSDDTPPRSLPPHGIDLPVPYDTPARLREPQPNRAQDHTRKDHQAPKHPLISSGPYGNQPSNQRPNRIPQIRYRHHGTDHLPPFRRNAHISNNPIRDAYNRAGAYALQRPQNQRCSIAACIRCRPQIRK